MARGDVVRTGSVVNDAVFDRPTAWRQAAVDRLGLRGEERLAGLTIGAGYPDALEPVTACVRSTTGWFGDVGSGLGAATAWIGRNDPGRMVAIEPEPRAAALAHRAFDALTVIAGCADELPVHAATFDGTSLLGVVSLVADLAGVLAEQARVVRPGGRLAIADLVSASSTAIIVEATGNHFRPLDELVAGMAAAGFAVDAVWTAPAAITTRWTAVAARVDAEIACQHSGSPVYAAWADDATHVRRLIDEASVSLATITATRLR